MCSSFDVHTSFSSTYLEIHMSKGPLATQHYFIANWLLSSLKFHFLGLTYLNKTRHDIFSGNVQHIRCKTSTTFIHWKHKITSSYTDALLFREEHREDGSHMGHLPASNWNLEIFIFEGEKTGLLWQVLAQQPMTTSNKLAPLGWHPAGSEPGWVRGKCLLHFLCSNLSNHRSWSNRSSGSSANLQ